MEVFGEDLALVAASLSALLPTVNAVACFLVISYRSLVSVFSRVIGLIDFV